MGDAGMVAKSKAVTAAIANGNGAVGRRGDSPLDRVLHALGHPVRRRILRSLVRRNGSASAMAKELEMDLSVVSYHLNQVLAKECAVVELVDAVERRGPWRRSTRFASRRWAAATRSASPSPPRGSGR